MAGMSRDLGRDVPGSEKLDARKLWADFSFPILSLSCFATNQAGTVFRARCHVDANAEVYAVYAQLDQCSSQYWTFCGWRAS